MELQKEFRDDILASLSPFLLLMQAYITSEKPPEGPSHIYKLVTEALQMPKIAKIWTGLYDPSKNLHRDSNQKYKSWCIGRQVRMRIVLSKIETLKWREEWETGDIYKQKMNWK